MSFEDVCETSPKMWKTLNFMVDCYNTKGRHSTRTSRWEADLRASVTRPAFGKERSDVGSGCWMAFDELGTMQMCVDDGGTMWRGVCWW
jgi:hypothetical protein